MSSPRVGSAFYRGLAVALSVAGVLAALCFLAAALWWWLA